MAGVTVLGVERTVLSSRDESSPAATGGGEVVVSGHFNPAIFHPAWLEAHHIVTPEMASHAENVLVHPELAHFLMDDFELEVTDEDLRISTRDEQAGDQLASLVRGVCEVLPHTPVVDISIQRFRDSASTASDPPTMWRSLVDDSIWGDVLVDVTATEVVVRGPLPARDDPGEAAVIAEPSAAFPDGVFIAYVERRVLASEKTDGLGVPAGKVIPPLLSHEWKAIWERAGHVLDELEGRLTRRGQERLGRGRA